MSSGSCSFISSLKQMENNYCENQIKMCNSTYNMYNVLVRYYLWKSRTVKLILCVSLGNLLFLKRLMSNEVGVFGYRL